MNKYPKIQNVFLRDPDTKYRTLLTGQYSLDTFEYLYRNTWEATEKVDGMNVRVIYSPMEERFIFKGRTDKAQMPSQLLKHLNKIFEPLYKKFKIYFDYAPVCLYGEGYGAGIQNGGKYRDNQGFVMFDIKVGHAWLPQSVVHEVALEFDIERVPVIHQGTLPDLVQFVRNGFTSFWGDFYAEGIIARPIVEMQNCYGRRIMVKIKHNDFVNENK